jgi:elongator complex protein 1
VSIDIVSGEVAWEQDLEIEPDNAVVGVQYVPDTEAVIVATRKGDILEVSKALSNSPLLDCIGSVETGIEHMAWSPDFEVVIFATGVSTMLMMTQTWETIFELPIQPENESAQIAARLAISEPSKIKLQTTINDVVRVNEAKSQVAAQMQLAKDAMPKIDHVGKHTVSWRGDGQYFAVTGPTTETGEQVNPTASQFRVYERNGKFFSKSEDGVLTQSRLLAWKPSGDVLASVQSLPTHDEVIFFERNGLRHYEFKILPDNARVVDLQWNASSDILSTVVRLPSTSQEHRTALLLWSTRNYHWYLKQELLFAEDHISVNWDAENGMVFTVLNESGVIDQYTLVWDTDLSRGTQLPTGNASQISATLASNHSVAAVIDGSQLRITALKYQVVPPPMATVTITAHATIKQVVFDLANNFFLLHADGSVSLYAAYQPVLEPGKAPRYNIVPKLIARSEKAVLKGARQVVLIGNDEFLALNCTHSKNSLQEELQHYHFSVIPAKEGDINAVAQLKVELLENHSLPRASKMFQNADTGNVFIQVLDQSIWHFDVVERQLAPKPNMKVPAICPWLCSAVFSEGEEYLIGLTTSFKLYVGEVLLSSECNSFALHSDYLLFTTLTHRLRTISLHKSVQENLQILTPKLSIKFDDSTREVEQGSVIVAVVPFHTRVVLQMPRGNLEAIEPRSLVLHAIRSHLDRQEYKQAFEVMRKQRINLNLFYDHNPSLFMEHINDFLDQITDTDHLNLFISSLTAEDCTKTTYVDVFGHASLARQAHRNNPFTSAASMASSMGVVSAPTISAATEASSSGAGSGKPHAHATASRKPSRAHEFVLPVHTDDAGIKARLQPLKIGKDTISATARKLNTVCDTLRAQFEKRGGERFLLPILTTLVCKEPAEVELALRMVQKIRKAELEEAGVSSNTSLLGANVTSDKALKYLVFLVDVNKLYDIALGMYDFDLVILVAQKSQKDPREYLPFLADLQKQDGPFQRYSIDAHLGKWESALKNLANAGSARFEMCLELIRKHNLYVHALNDVFVEIGSETRNTVLEIYGDHLAEAKQYERAVVAYQSGNKLMKALLAAKSDANWRQLVSLGYQLGLPTQSRDEWLAHLQDVATLCMDRFKCEDAAIILEQFLERPAEALTCLLQGNLWTHAQMLCHRYGMADKLQSELVPALLSAFDTLLKYVQERTVKLSKYHNRLITVRANKYLQAQSESSPLIEGSETSSMYSGSSQSSSQSRGSKLSKGSKFSKSSKSSKASSRSTRSSKKVSGRKGSPNEEQFLVQELPGLLPSTQTQQDVSNLLSALFQFGLASKAITLTKALEEWISRGSRALALINTPSPFTREEQQDFDAAKMGADELQRALVNPPTIPNATLKVLDWQLPMLPK